MVWVHTISELDGKNGTAIQTLYPQIKLSCNKGAHAAIFSPLFTIQSWTTMTKDKIRKKDPLVIQWQCSISLHAYISVSVYKAGVSIYVNLDWKVPSSEVSISIDFPCAPCTLCISSFIS